MTTSIPDCAREGPRVVSPSHIGVACLCQQTTFSTHLPTSHLTTDLLSSGPGCQQGPKWCSYHVLQVNNSLDGVGDNSVLHSQIEVFVVYSTFLKDT